MLLDIHPRAAWRTASRGREDAFGGLFRSGGALLMIICFRQRGERKPELRRALGPVAASSDGAAGSALGGWTHGCCEVAFELLGVAARSVARGVSLNAPAVFKRADIDRVEAELILQLGD